MTMNPIETLDVLRKLQSLDDEVRDITERRDQIVGKLTQLKRVLEAFDASLADKRAKLAEAELWHRQKSGELESAREKLTKGKAKLTSVTRSREYVAVNKELENARKEIVQREDDVAKLLVAIDEFRAVIAKDEDKTRDLRSEAEQAQRETEQNLAVMQVKIDAVATRRLAVTSTVERAIVARFEKIAKARAGRAVVPVVDACCKGCNIHLQPQIIEQILRGSSLVACPHCQRYLYADSAHAATGGVAA